MHTAHAIVGHLVLIPILFAAFAGILVLAFRLDRGGSRAGGLSDPLDVELMRSWDDRTHGPATS